jgi:hypothetical protein
MMSNLVMVPFIPNVPLAGGLAKWVKENSLRRFWVGLRCQLRLVVVRKVDRLIRTVD